ncbi:MAG: hypothetical protein QXV37_00585 [Candidatus Jordarchaeaceae archaeon]
MTRENLDSDRLLNESRELVRRALQSVEERRAVINELNKDVDVSKIALVVLQMSFESKNLAEEILNGLDLPVLVERLDSEKNVETIRKFFSYTGQASSGTQSSWIPEWLAEKMDKEILVNKLNQALEDVMTPLYFLDSMRQVNKIVAKELSLKLDWSRIIENLNSSGNLSSLALCLRCLVAIDPVLVEEFIKKIDVEKIVKIVERENDPKKLEDILLCVFQVRGGGVAYDFVWSIIKSGVSNLLKKDLQEIKHFLIRIGGNEALKIFSLDKTYDREEIISILLECMTSEKLASKINAEKDEVLVESFLRKIVKVNPIIASELREKIIPQYQKFLEDITDSTETSYY